MQDEVVIRQSRTKLVVGLVVVTLAVVMAISGVTIFMRSASIGAILFVIFIGLLFLALLIYLIKELFGRKAEIAISREGVYLRNLGLYPWSLIESFSTVEDRDAMVSLVLHFEKYADEDFDFTSLEIVKDDIVNLMLAYKGSSNVYYAGHKKI